jgi:hypothetical protein
VVVSASPADPPDPRHRDQARVILVRLGLTGDTQAGVPSGPGNTEVFGGAEALTIVIGRAAA